MSEIEDIINGKCAIINNGHLDIMEKVVNFIKN